MSLYWKTTSLARSSRIYLRGSDTSPQFQSAYCPAVWTLPVLVCPHQIQCLDFAGLPCSYCRSSCMSSLPCSFWVFWPCVSLWLWSLWFAAGRLGDQWVLSIAATSAAPEELGVNPLCDFCNHEIRQLLCAVAAYVTLNTHHLQQRQWNSVTQTLMDSRGFSVIHHRDSFWVTLEDIPLCLALHESLIHLSG